MITEPDSRQWDHDAQKLEAHAFIQWKGTDVCMDFRCTCGARPHFDGFFAYAVKCGECGTVWEMPMYVFPRAVTDPALIKDLLVQSLEADENE